MTEDTNNDPHADIGCLQAIEALYAYLDGELDDVKSVAAFEHHMQHCRSCYTRAEVEGLLTDRIREAARQQAPASLQARLQRILDDF